MSDDLKKQPLVRFGKSNQGYLEQKSFFFDLASNDKIIADNERVTELYKQQPLRERCKACNSRIKKISFAKHGIDYLICPDCSHVNGAHQDTDAFCRAVYADDGGTAMAAIYKEEDKKAFQKRVADIYQPKAAFLFDALRHDGQAPEELAYADLGAGSGFFVNALVNQSAGTVSGYEVSSRQVEQATQMLGEGCVLNASIEQLTEITGGAKADVFSLIFVLEHLQNPREIFHKLATNPHARYAYISVPLFGAGCYLEAAAPSVAERILAYTHTHVFTENSLLNLGREFGFESIGEWWFGGDMFDLLRGVTIRLKQDPTLSGMADMWAERVAPALDDMQLALDKRKLCSEVHMLFKIK